MSQPRHPLRRAGFTLAEMVVVLFLVLAVAGMVAQVLVPSALLFRLQSSRSDVQQGPLVFISHVQRAMLNTLADTVTIGTNPTAISYCEVDEGDPYDVSTGLPKPRPWFNILYYDAADGRVWAKRWPEGAADIAGYDFAAAEQPLALSVADLRTICLRKHGSERVLVKNVSELAITDGAGGSGLVLPLSFKITCRQRSGTRNEQDEVFSLSARLMPRSTRW